MADHRVPDARLAVTKAEAIARGEVHYFTGKPCRRGHLAHRYTSDSACYQCALEKCRKWQANNREKSSLSAQKWQRNNPERARAAQKARWAANPERCREIARKSHRKNPGTKRKWQQNNKQSYRRYAHNRRALKAACGGTYAVNDILHLLEQQKHKCASCAMSLKRRYEIDHIKPLALGGSNTARNLQLLCMPCNRSKGAKDPVTWAQENGRLL